MNLKYPLLIGLTLLVGACVVTRPPSNVENICYIFKQYPQWYRYARDVERRWKISVPVQFAIIYQESRFNATAKPPRTHLFSVIPWKRPSTAYGYTQALDGTWNLYRKNSGWFWSSRQSFADGVDFIGWYANEAYLKAKIPRNDAYSLYLAYHEGIGGYLHRTYLKKSWLMHVAQKVRVKAAIYRAQLNACSM